MIYVDAVILIVLIWIVIRLQRKPEIKTIEPSSQRLEDWDTTNAIPWCEMFTCKTKSDWNSSIWRHGDDAYKTMTTLIEDDITARDEIVCELVKDLKIFQAYYCDYTVQQLIVFSIAYLLQYKMHYKTAHIYLGMLRRFDFVPKTRTDDQADAALDMVDSKSRNLLAVIIERNIMHCIKIDHYRYENLIINTVISLCRVALEDGEYSEEFN